MFIEMTYVYTLFLYDKSILNGISVIQGYQDDLRHTMRPHQAQPWVVQQVGIGYVQQKLT